MRRQLIVIPLAALVLLAGCSGTDEPDVAARISELELENELLRGRLDRLNKDIEPLAERLHEINEDHRRLTRTLGQVEQDLRSRLHEMVQQESSGGRRRFVRPMGPVAPAPVPEKPRPYLGFDAQTLSAKIAEQLGLTAKAGVLVTDVRAGAPAQVGGLKKDDVVVKVDGTEVESKVALAKVVMAKKPGDPVTLGLLRGGKQMQLTITLGRR